MKFISFILFFSLLSIYSQNKKIDSLQLLLKSEINQDTSRVNAINELANLLFHNDKEKTIKLLKEAIYISDSIHYSKGKNESFYILGKTLTEKIKYDEAEKVLDKSINGFKLSNDTIGIVKVTNQLGVICFFKGDYQKALEYFYKALGYKKKNDNSIFFANVYSNIGLICNIQNKTEKALEFYDKALIMQRKANEPRNLVALLINLGIIYIDREDYKYAFDLLDESLEITKTMNDDYLSAYIYHNFGVLYERKKDYYSALKYYFKALKIHKNIDNINGISYSYNGISSVYIKLKKYDKALRYISINQKNVKKYSLLNHQVDIEKMLSDIFLERKDYKKAFQHFQAYKKGDDSIHKEEINKKIADLEAKYKFKTKELLAREKELKLNKEIDQANKKLYKTKKQVLYGLIVGLFVFVILGFLMYNSRISRLSLEYQKVVLKQKLLRSQMKPHFIFNSLSVLQGIVLHKEYDKASVYISKFSRLLREILENSKEEIINLETEIRIIESYIFLQKISHTANCSYQINVDKRINVKNFYIPPMIVQPIVENSYEHGFVELNKSYELSIDFNLEDDKLICTIIDNGEGIGSSNKRNYYEKKKSFSSTIIKERLELFSKKYGKKYNFKVIDRKIDGLKGTKVILLLPYKKEFVSNVCL